MNEIVQTKIDLRFVLLFGIFVFGILTMLTFKLPSFLNMLGYIVAYELI